MRDSNNLDFLTKARFLNKPFYVTMELTYRCNLSCIHCYLGGVESGELSTKEVCSLIDQLAEEGCFQLILTGGEALLREDFFEIAAHGRRNNLALSLISNGILINEEIAAHLKELSFQDVSISIYGMLSHDFITGMPGSLEKSLAAIRFLVDNKLKVQIKTPVMTINAEEIQELGELCDKMGVEFQPNPAITGRISGLMDTVSLRMNDSQLGDFLRLQAQRKVKYSGLRTFCNTGRTMAAISPQGDVYPCISLREKVGSIRERSFRDIWMKSPYLNWLRDLELADLEDCIGCETREYCQLCPGESRSEEGSILERHEYSCQIAHAIKEIYTQQKLWLPSN